MSKRIVILMLVASLLGWFLKMNALGETKPYDEPIYYIKFSLSHSALEVLLNDIPVLATQSTGITESEKPVPEYIVDGDNTITVRIRQLDDSDDLIEQRPACTVKLVVREKGAAMNESSTIATIDIGFSDPDLQALLDNNEPRRNDIDVVKTDEKELTAKRIVPIKSPYPRWAWQNGLIIEDSPDNYASLLQEYIKIHDALRAGDIETVQTVYQAAAEEYAAAYHYDDPKQGHRIMDTGGFIGNDDWVLGDIQKLFEKEVPLKLELYADGRLARIVNEKGKEAVIVYFNKKLRVLSYQKFGFYKRKDGAWVMIR